MKSTQNRLLLLTLFIIIACFGCASIEDEYSSSDEFIDEPQLGSADASYSVILPDEQSYDCPSDTANTEGSDPDRVFCLNNDDSFETISGAEAWEEDFDLVVDFLQIFPSQMRANVVLISFSSEDEGEGVASMSAIYDDNIYWEMWINTNQNNPETRDEKMDTLAHELMHYMSLNPMVVDLGNESCGVTFEASGYCPIEGSFFAEYIHLFWEPIYGEWTVENYNEYYDANPDEFVTPYAVSEPAEDIAETFAKFVFQERPTNITTIKEQKIDFFWQSEEFVSMRYAIRSAYDG